MLKKSFLFFLLSLLPFWAAASGTMPQKKDLVTFDQLSSNIASRESSLKFRITLSDSKQFGHYHDTHEQLPSGNSRSQNSDEPEKKEEKNENNEDQDLGALSYNCLISAFRHERTTLIIYSTDNLLGTTPLYILFHSWKSYLN